MGQELYTCESDTDASSATDLDFDVESDSDSGPDVHGADNTQELDSWKDQPSVKTSSEMLLVHLYTFLHVDVSRVVSTLIQLSIPY